MHGWELDLSAQTAGLSVCRGRKATSRYSQAELGGRDVVNRGIEWHLYNEMVSEGELRTHNTY